MYCLPEIHLIDVFPIKTFWLIGHYPINRKGHQGGDPFVPLTPPSGTTMTNTHPFVSLLFLGFLLVCVGCSPLDYRGVPLGPCTVRPLFSFFVFFFHHRFRSFSHHTHRKGRRRITTMPTCMTRTRAGRAALIPSSTPTWVVLLPSPTTSTMLAERPKSAAFAMKVAPPHPLKAPLSPISDMFPLLGTRSLRRQWSAEHNRTGKRDVGLKEQD